jgi:hypothetical protein
MDLSRDSMVFMAFLLFKVILLNLMMISICLHTIVLLCLQVCLNWVHYFVLFFLRMGLTTYEIYNGFGSIVDYT